MKKDIIEMTNVQSNPTNNANKRPQQYMKILKRQSTDFGE